MRARVPFLALAVLLTAAAASAQYRGGTIELNPYAGYLVGGDYGNRDLDFNLGHLQVEDHVIYGGRIGYNFTNLWETELEYAQSDTHLEADLRDDRQPDVRVADLRFQYFLGYLTVNF